MKKVLTMLLFTCLCVALFSGCQNKTSDARSRMNEVDKELGSTVTDIMEGVKEFKEDIGLPSEDTHDFSEEDIQKIKEGMTYEEVCEALNGTQGKKSDMQDAVLYSWFSNDYKVSVGCAFTDGKVSTIIL